MADQSNKAAKDQDLEQSILAWFFKVNPVPNEVGVNGPIIFYGSFVSFILSNEAELSSS